MRRVAALGGAVLLTLVLAGPAAANQKTYMPELSGAWEFEQVIDTSTCAYDPVLDEWVGWCEPWQCTGPVYYGGWNTVDFWLWYPNSVDTTDPDEYMPANRAWPWITGQQVIQGLTYFSSAPGMGDEVISGAWKLSDNITKHHLGTRNDPNDPESWQVLTSGRLWSIQAPGYGTVAHQSGSRKGTVYVVEQVPGDPQQVWVGDGREWRGNYTFDAEALCAFFGFEAAG
jgi:hypothetical protein